MTVLPYPVCRCGHRYDHHTDPSDPRGVGCWHRDCPCVKYRPKGMGPTRTTRGLSLTEYALIGAIVAGALLIIVALVFGGR